MHHKLHQLTIILGLVVSGHLTLLVLSSEYRAFLEMIAAVSGPDLIPILVQFIAWGLVALIGINLIGGLKDR